MAKKKNRMATPHDAFVKSYLSTPAECKAFISAYFAPSITKHITRVELTNKSFVNRAFRQTHSDLVFKLQMDNGALGYVYILCEHQSTPDKFTLLRVFEYTIELIQSHMKMHPKEEKWPLVLTACLYHGKQSPYPYPTIIDDYFQNPALANQVGIFRKCQIIDLTVMDDKTLEKHQGIALMEKILKYVRLKNFTLCKLEEILATELASGRLRSSEVDKLKIVLQYLLHILNGEEYCEADIVNLFQDKLKKKDMITVAQKMRQEAMQQGMQAGMQKGMQQGMQAGMQQGMQAGMQQGIQKGMQQEKLEIAKNMLFNLHVGMDVVQKATGLSREALTRLKPF